MESEGNGFCAGMSRKLRRRGLRGSTAAVGFDGATLSVAGDTFGSIDIALAELRRVRVGMAQPGRTIQPEILSRAEYLRSSDLTAPNAHRFSGSLSAKRGRRAILLWRDLPRWLPQSGTGLG